MKGPITPNLWFDTQAHEAAEFYCSIFPDSRIVNVLHYNDAVPSRAGQVLTVDFELKGQRFTAINGGPEFTFDEAVSFLVECEDQEELDRYWDALQAGGGQDGPCGWLKDRYGLSWQVVPTGMVEMFQDPDQDRARRATEAMLKMRKIDIAEIRRAADGVTA